MAHMAGVLQWSYTDSLRADWEGKEGELPFM